MVRGKLPESSSSDGLGGINGSWVNDPVFSTLQGFYEAYELTNQAHLLYGEVESIES